jgi:hypothetical protein
MAQTTKGRGSPLGPILAIGGGAIVAIGSFLTWFTLSATGGFSSSGSGTDAGDGWITLAVGVLMVIAGLVILAGRSRGVVRGMAILAIVGGVIAAGDGLLNLATARDQLAESVAESTGLTKDQARQQVDLALDSGQAELSADIGLWMVIGGGVIGFVGGILGLTAAKRAPVGAAAAAPPAPEGTLTGFSAPQPAAPASPPAAPPAPPPAAPPPAAPEAPSVSPAAPAPPPPPSGAGAGAGVPPPPPPQPDAPAPEQPASGAMGTPPPEEEAPPGDRPPGSAP